MPTPDFTHLYNTPIPPEKQEAFNRWVQKTGRARDAYDYDIQGAWLAGGGQDPRGHFPDTFKKPNHPTFSIESKYSTPQMPGGHWTDKGFVADQSNLKYHSPEDLQAYFKQVEPDSILQLPPNAPRPATAPQPQMHPLTALGSLLSLFR